MIDNQKLQELIRLMVENDLTEIDIADGTESLTLRRPSQNQPVVMAASPSTPQLVHAAQPVPPSDSVGTAPSEDEDSGLIAVSSPMVGTFYAQPKPDEPPFVSTGSEIQQDTVICLVEAMKVFNEIKAEVSGVIERILVANAEPVEFGQKLFLVRPR